MAALPRCTEGTWKRSAAPRVDWPVYPRRAKHNTVAEGGNRICAEADQKTRSHPASALPGAGQPRRGSAARGIWPLASSSLFRRRQPPAERSRRWPRTPRRIRCRLGDADGDHQGPSRRSNRHPRLYVFKAPRGVEDRRPSVGAHVVTWPQPLAGAGLRGTAAGVWPKRPEASPCPSYAVAITQSGNADRFPAAVSLERDSVGGDWRRRTSSA